MEEKNLIGQRIKAAREEAGLSQEKLGKLVGVVFQSVQQWEIGKTTPRAHRIRKIAAALNTSPNWLQFGTGNKSSENIDNLEQLLNSEEFKSISGAAFSKVLMDATRLGWIKLSGLDVSVKTLSDLFYLRLFEEYGISDHKQEQLEQSKSVNQ